MEFIRPLSPPSLLQRIRIFLLDVFFVCVCVRRFLIDHVWQPHPPLPQPVMYKHKYQPPYISAREKARDGETYGGDVSPESPSSTTSSTSPTSPNSDSTETRIAAKPHSAPHQLRVLSLNIWGLPISPRTDVRAAELAKTFPLFDIVCMQELSHEREMRVLNSKAREAGLKYSHQFTNGVGFPIWHGVTAPGLVVFSRFPILDVHFKRFSINGKMYQAAHSDYMGAKGVGLVRVDVSEVAYPTWSGEQQCRPVIGVDVFLTHLHANYTDYTYDWRLWLPWLREKERERRFKQENEDEEDRSNDALANSMPIPLLAHISDEYLAHRVAQSYECARFISAYRRDDFMTLLCGDLNCPPYDLCIQLIQAITFGQSLNYAPRFVDTFAELHPYSNGYTCGAKDNSFTFSTEPIRMERRMCATQQSNIASHRRRISRSAQSKEGRSLLRTNRKGQSSAPASSSGIVNSANASSSTTADETEAAILRRLRFNSSPTDPALVPADADLRVSRTTYGEHVTLLPSSSPNAANDPQALSAAFHFPIPSSVAAVASAVSNAASTTLATASSCVVGTSDSHKQSDLPASTLSSSGAATLGSPDQSPTSNTNSQPSTSSASVSDATNSAASKQSPLAWRDEDTPKRIDYIFYANPSTKPPCANCDWSATQLPFHHTATGACSNCALYPSSTGSAPASLWSVKTATIFKQYMLEPTIEGDLLTSISDHHGMCVTFEFNAQPQSDDRSPKEQDELEQEEKDRLSTSTIVISKLPLPPEGLKPSTAKSPSASPSSSARKKLDLKPSPMKPLRGNKFVVQGELFTLDTAPAPMSPRGRMTPSPINEHPTIEEVEELESSSAASSTTPTAGGSQSEGGFPSYPPSAASAVPSLSASTILLLAEGVLWFGLRDASDRRSAHLQRMGHALAIFIIGSRTMWMYILNRYFEHIMAEILPEWFQTFPFPVWFITMLRALLFVIDWAHTFLPIYMVLEYLLTTFPAKEEQTTLRQTIAEMSTLRKFNRKWESMYLNRQGKQRSSKSLRQTPDPITLSDAVDTDESSTSPVVASLTQRKPHA